MLCKVHRADLARKEKEQRGLKRERNRLNRDSMPNAKSLKSINAEIYGLGILLLNFNIAANSPEPCQICRTLTGMLGSSLAEYYSSRLTPA
jgi:hypothetical protein